MFKQIHGEITGQCYLEVDEDDEDDEYKPCTVRVMKDGNECWRATKVDLVFDYLTRHLDT